MAFSESGGARDFDLVVDDLGARERLTMGSHRVVTSGHMQRLVPDFSKAMARDLEYLELPPGELRPEDFAPFLEPGTSRWEEYMKTRKVVERDRPDGSRFAAVTSNVADKLQNPEQRIPTPREVLLPGPPAPKPKRFEVAHLLVDVDLAHKFSIKGSFRADMRNLAVVDTQRAAVKLQERVRSYEGYEKAVVVAGSYARSWKAARESIKMQAAAYPDYSVAVEARVVGSKIFLYDDQLDLPAWQVCAPLNVAEIGYMVHKMVLGSSPDSVMFAMGPELTVLAVDIVVDDDVLTPYRERHIGSHDDLPVGMSMVLASSLSLSDKKTLIDTCEAAVETVSADGIDCATAVRISSSQILVNAHVLEGEGPILSNGCAVRQDKMLSKDLWLAKSAGPEVAWHIRQPMRGERAVLCFRRHDTLVFSDPVEVLSTDSAVLAVEKTGAMLPGASGAAVVALADYALLGLYEGVSMRRGIVAAFNPKMYVDICSVSVSSAEGRAIADKSVKTSVYNALKNRGFGKILDAAMDSMVPVYSGDVHVGMGFQVGERVYTTCDPDLAPMSVARGDRPLIFSRFSSGLYQAEVPAVRGMGPAVVRKPSYGEEVFVVGRDEDGHYYSHTEAKVQHVGLDACCFKVTGLTSKGSLPLAGGLVIAHTDAAVVGVFGVLRVDKKGVEVGHCMAYPVLRSSETTEERPEAAILSVFPFLRPGAWPDGLAEGVITHTSIPEKSQMVALGKVGDSALRTALWMKLRGLDVPNSQWMRTFNAVQSNAVFAEKCVQLGLHKLLRTAAGVTIVDKSKVHADMIEALAGAVFEAEPTDVFENFCEVIGALEVVEEHG